MKSLFGYADRLSVRPRQTIAFHISATDWYRAGIVHLDHALLPGRPPTFPHIPSDIDGEHEGSAQETPIGSCAIWRQDDPTAIDDGFAFCCWLEGGTPGNGREQCILSLDDGVSGNVLWLGLDGAGFMELRLAHGDGIQTIQSQHLTLAHHWYFVSVSLSARPAVLTLAINAIPRLWFPASSHQQSVSLPEFMGCVFQQMVLAADVNRETISGADFPEHCFDGKIDRPAMWLSALSPEEIYALSVGRAKPDEIRKPWARWDAARDFGSSLWHDDSGNGRTLQLINAPTRGVTGANWDGSSASFLENPEHYGAIAFHADDLEDAKWESQHQWTVPEDLASGIYALRVHNNDDEDLIPFYVRPEADGPRAAVLYLAPTNTYLAYGNEKTYTILDTDPGWVEKSAMVVDEMPQWVETLKQHPEFGASVYDNHPDGSAVCYSSRLRPLITFRPDFTLWLSGDLRHFAADLMLTEWLQGLSIPFDVATDEDLHVDGEALLSGYRVVITGSHPEYWTSAMLDALSAYLASGGNLVYLGGNGFYWATGMQSNRPHLVEIRRGYTGTRTGTSPAGEASLSLNGEPGGIWRYRGRDPNALTGVGFAAQGWGGAAGYRQLADARDPRVSFIFEGIGADEVIGDFGYVMGGAAGDEIDRYDLAHGTPPETLRLATSEGLQSDYYQLVIEDCTAVLPGMGGTEEPRVRADITWLESGHGGAVFSTGSINWIGSLLWNEGDNNVSRMTSNVIRRFVTQQITDPLE